MLLEIIRHRSWAAGYNGNADWMWKKFSAIKQSFFELLDKRSSLSPTLYFKVLVHFNVSTHVYKPPFCLCVSIDQRREVVWRDGAHRQRDGPDLLPTRRPVTIRCSDNDLTTTTPIACSQAGTLVWLSGPHMADSQAASSKTRRDTHADKTCSARPGATGFYNNLLSSSHK